MSRLEKLKLIAAVLLLVNFSFLAATIYRFKMPKSDYHYAAYSQAELYDGLSDNDKIKPLNEEVYGGIVSHHFFVAREISKFFLQMRNQAPPQVVILGPNHFNTGNNNILLSDYDYQTPWGVLPADHNIIKQLAAGGLAKIEEKPFAREHSISTLVGFIKKVFPDTKIVPIIIKRNTSAADTAALADELINILPPRSLVIASVDFSHHLNRIAASYHDSKSIAAISSFALADLPKIEVDSPQSIAVLLEYLQSRGAEKITWTNTNSARFSNNLSSEDVTSYLFAHFTTGRIKTDNKVSILNWGKLELGAEIDGNLLAAIKGVEGNFLRGENFINLKLKTPANCQPAVVPQFRRNNVNIIYLEDSGCVGGLEEIKAALAAQGLDYFTAKDPENNFIIKSAAGYDIAFVGFSALNAADDYKLITRLKSENDFVVVHINWGDRASAAPSASQRARSRQLIDSGADVVIGHQAYAQNLEIYKQKPIFYSLGDFTPSSNQAVSLGVGMILDKIGGEFYIFPFRNVNNRPQLLPYKETVDYCFNYLNDVRQADVCQFILPALD